MAFNETTWSGVVCLGQADPEKAKRLIASLLHPYLGKTKSQETASRLVGHFGSLGEVLGAPASRLLEVQGMGSASAGHLADVFAAARWVAAERVRPDRPILSSWSQLIDYCRLQMAFEFIEQVRIVFLDRKNRLIADEVIHTGTVDHTPVYPREIIRRALELSATGLIVVHNHPSGDPSPSQGDLRMTKELSSIAMSLGMALHDHIIVGRSGHASLRGMLDL